METNISHLPSPVKTEEVLLDRYNTYFEATTAETDDEIRQAQRIRYEVYCTENPFENPADHPTGFEQDAFDAHAVHSVLVHRPSRQAMGTTRLILPVDGALQRSFPIQQVCSHPDLARLPLHRTAEVSRFSISKTFRRRASDAQYEGQTHDASPVERRALAPLMSLGLIQSLVRMSAEQGITHWCATMEPKLLRMLAAMGIHFEPLGPLVEYHGLRQPCYCAVAPMLERVKRERPDLWEVLTDGGTLVQEEQRLAA